MEGDLGECEGCTPLDTPKISSNTLLNSGGLRSCGDRAKPPQGPVPSQLGCAIFD